MQNLQAYIKLMKIKSLYTLRYKILSPIDLKKKLLYLLLSKYATLDYSMVDMAIPILAWKDKKLIDATNFSQDF